MHFTEDEIREIRNRLPLEVPTVTDNVSSSDGSSALSAKQGKLLDERVDVVEGVAAAMLHVQTIYPWTGVSGIYSMVSAPDDTVNNATNARVAYELKKRTDDLTTSVNYIMQIISELGTGGGGGGGSTVSWGIEDSSAHTVPLVVNGVSKTVCLNGYSSGGGGTGSGYIGTTGVQNASQPQSLTGIIDATLSGNLTVGGTVFLPAAGKIVFGSNASTDPFIEYSVSDTQFHFNKGLYSNFNVTAGGISSGGGGGGGGATTLSGLDDVNSSLSPTAGQVLYYDNTLSPAKWNAHTLTIQELLGLQSLSAGYLKYTGSGWAFDSGSSPSGTLYLGSSGHPQSSLSGDVSMSSFYNGQVLYYYNGSWTNASLNVSDIGLAPGMSGPGYLYYSNGAWSLVAGGGPGTDTYRPIKVDGYSFLSDATSGGYVNFKGGTGITLSYTPDGHDITITASGGGGGSVGTLNTTATTAQTTSSSESFGNSITLHKIAKTGTYSDLLNKPTLDDISDGSTRKLSDYVTLTTDQHTISGAKSFTNSAGIGIGSSSNTLKYNSSQNRFEFNGNLYVTGNIVATGNVTAGS